MKLSGCCPVSDGYPEGAGSMGREARYPRKRLRRQKEWSMETVGFECYNNGTVRPAVMRVKDTEPRRKGSKDEFYGSFLTENRKKKREVKLSKK
jgi:hypothetical protein